MKLQNPQLKGGHYAPILGITPDMIVTPLPFWLGSALKYVWRAPRKNGGEDFLKAADCLRRYAEYLTENMPTKQPYDNCIRKSEVILEHIQGHNNLHALAISAVLRVVLWGYPRSEIHQVENKEKIFSLGVRCSNQLYATADNLEEWAQHIDDAKNIWHLVGEK